LPKIKKTAERAIEAGDAEALSLALTPKQSSFVREYIVDFNASRAAVAAGYKDSPYINRVGSELLRHPAVRTAIDAALAERAKTVDVDVGYVLKTITRAIEKSDAAGKHGDVLRGAELLARYLGMFVERKEVDLNQTVNYKQMEDDAASFTRAIARLIERGGEDGVPAKSLN
jgi:hypothetical protein